MLLKISVITPSFNEAAYPEKAVRSVLGQCHRDDEAKTADGYVGYHAARIQYIRERCARLNYGDRMRLQSKPEVDTTANLSE